LKKRGIKTNATEFYSTPQIDWSSFLTHAYIINSRKIVQSSMSGVGWVDFIIHWQRVEGNKRKPDVD